MIRFVRTVHIQPGRLRPVMRGLLAIAQHVKATHGIDVQVAMPIGGNPNRISTMTKLRDMAAVETTLATLMADEVYTRLVEEIAPHLTSDGTHDEVWKVAA